MSNSSKSITEVIEGLKEISSEAYSRWVHCQYTRDKLILDIGKYVDDAIELLKEKETVRPIKGILCGNCSHRLFAGENYCPHCGKNVIWSEFNF